MSDESRTEGTARRVSRLMMSDVSREKARLLYKRVSEVTRQLFRNPMGSVGVVILIAFALLGAFGEQVAPYDVLVGKYDTRFGALKVPTALGETHTVYLYQGEYAMVEGTFIEKPGWPGPNPAKYSLLSVVTEPSVPTTIYIDGIWRNGWGLDDVKFPLGEHTISFSSVPGYVTPDPIKVNLEGNSEVTEVVARFVEHGRLNVTVEPLLPATIFVDGFPRDEGKLSSYVPPGTYTISYGAVEGYDTPANLTVTVASGETVDAVGVYTANASAPGPDLSSYFTLRVVTSPSLETTVFVDSNWTTQWGLDGLKLPVPAEGKKHVVEFTDVPGYLTPNAVSLYPEDCVPGEVYELEVVFIQCALLEARINPNIGATIVVNGEVRNDWSLSVYVRQGEYHVTFQTIDDYAVPPPGYMVEIEKALPLVVFLGASLFALRGVRRFTGSNRRPLAVVLAIASVVAAAALLAIGVAGQAEVIDLDLPPLAYVAGLAAVSLAIVSSGLTQAHVDRDIGIAILIAVLIPVPFALTLFVDVGPMMLSDLRFAAYLASGLLFAIGAALVNRPAKRTAFAYSVAEDERAAVYSHLGRNIKFMGVLIAAGLVLSGLVLYMVQHWTLHWMGTNNFGADILSELLVGARTSIIVGVFSAVIASVLGAIVGLYSGYVGGRVDEVIMRLNDIVLSIPWLVLMIIVAAMLGKIDLIGIILIIGLTGWSPTARMVRAQVLSIRERQYIERARAVGSSDMGIIRRHVLPNAFPLVFANTILTVAVSILSEATLSFLGFRPVGTVTWGTMLSYAQDMGALMIGLSSWIVVPGMCIVLIVLGFSLLGYALDDIMNPKLRKR